MTLNVSVRCKVPKKYITLYMSPKEKRKKRKERAEKTTKNAPRYTKNKCRKEIDGKGDMIIEET